MTKTGKRTPFVYRGYDAVVPPAKQSWWRRIRLVARIILVGTILIVLGIVLADKVLGPVLVWSFKH